MRHAFALIAATSIALGTGSAGATSARPAKRPNIVFILSDDHAWQAISAYRPVMRRTPSIDRIAREGALLTRLLAPNSLCAPARAALLTGKLPHRNGIAINYDVFDGAQPTLQSRLHAVGYRTALFGKWHLKSDPTGFDEWEILSDLQGQGRYYNPHFQSPRGVRQRHGFATTITTDLALSWLRNRGDNDKPFALMMWHKGPHRPFDPDVTAPRQANQPIPPPPASLWDNYAGRPQAQFQRMEVARDLNPRDLKLEYPAGVDVSQKAAWDRRYSDANAQFYAARPLGKAAVLWNYNRYISEYLSSAAAVDDSVGKVLDELDRQGLSENTIVIYSSDQGFYLGEHGWFDKRWFYEESLRAPFLIRWPGHIQAGTRMPAVTSQIDVLPTLLEATEVTPTTDIQGRSFLPALLGEKTATARSAYLHYSECPGEHVVPCFYGLATDRFKLIYFYQSGIRRWELYDRMADPAEKSNLYDDPRYRKIQGDLHRQLDAARRDAGDAENPETIGGVAQRFVVTMAERVVKLLRLGETAQ